MTAIETHFIGPTNRRGSRVKATALGTGHTKTIAWEDAKNPDQNHTAAARALTDKLGWTTYGVWHMADGHKGARIFVCALDRGAQTFRAPDPPPTVIQTSCRHCNQDIENVAPFHKGQWRDRGNNTHCPTPAGDAGQLHAPRPSVPSVPRVRTCR